MVGGENDLKSSLHCLQTKRVLKKRNIWLIDFFFRSFTKLFLEYFVNNDTLPLCSSYYISPAKQYYGKNNILISYASLMKKVVIWLIKKTKWLSLKLNLRFVSFFSTSEERTFQLPLQTWHLANWWCTEWTEEAIARMKPFLRFPQSLSTFLR